MVPRSEPTSIESDSSQRGSKGAATRDSAVPIAAGVPPLTRRHDLMPVMDRPTRCRSESYPKRFDRAGHIGMQLRGGRFLTIEATPSMTRPSASAERPSTSFGQNGRAIVGEWLTAGSMLCFPLFDPLDPGTCPLKQVARLPERGQSLCVVAGDRDAAGAGRHVDHVDVHTGIGDLPRHLAERSGTVRGG